MNKGSKRRRRVARRTAMAVVFIVAVAMVGVVAPMLSSGAPIASAVAIHDADGASAIAVVARIAELDPSLKFAQAVLPAAEANAAAAAAAELAAEASQRDVHANGPPPPSGASTSAADAVSSAILGDLAPEQATATVLVARQAVANSEARRDQLRGALAASSAERGRLLAELQAAGQARTHWSIQLLDRLGAPVTAENVRGLAAWIGAESNDDRLHNPLATTMGAAGARNANSVGVKGYPNVDIGLDATVRTLHNGFYPAILDAFMKGDSAQRLTQAVAASPWGTGVNAVLRLQMDGG